MAFPVVFFGVFGGALAAYLLNKFVLLRGGKLTGFCMIAALLAGIVIFIVGMGKELPVVGGVGIFIMQTVWVWGRFRELDILCKDGMYKDYPPSKQ